MDDEYKVTLEELEKYIEEEEVLAEEEYLSKYHKDYSDGTHQRELRRLKTVRKLLLAGANEMYWGDGCVYIQEGDTTFRFYLLNQMWSAIKNPYKQKVSWRGRKMYYCKSPEDFVKKYVLRNN